jgi:anaerobic selenocysteine-containing dehydrogenase
MIDAVKRLLHHSNGPLSRELELASAPGGLGLLPTHSIPTAPADLTCGFCSVGCRMTAHLQDGVAVNLTPRLGYPVNDGAACPKGWEALAPLDADDRAVVPLICRGDGRREPIAWDAALTRLVERFKAIGAKHGPEAVAFLGTGQLPTEELALFGSLCKFGMGMIHGDGNTRQCMATSVVAYRESFGFDAPPYTYQDLEESDVLVFVGANPAIAHPILWRRVLRNPHSPKIVVVDPRRTETAMYAAKHLAVRPKGDLALLYALTRVLIAEGRVDREFVAAHTTGFDELVAHVEPFTLDVVAEQTGVPAEDLLAIARLIGEGKRVSFWWTMGVNQSHQGVRTAQAIINLALVTGNIGKPGTGANSITGQCNAMGSRLFANTTNLLGGRKFEDQEHRREVADILGIDVGTVPSQGSWAYDQILEGVLRGRIKGLWIVGTNPAHSWINQGQARDILSRLDFLVVQDMYHTTETALAADLLLPAAGWGEKEGTFINSERRISTIKRVRRPPGQALSDFAIFKAVAEAWGCGDTFRKWTSPTAAFILLRELSAGRPCDFTGIEGYAMLDAVGGIQWPFRSGTPIPTNAAESQRRLFSDGKFFTPDGRAKLIVDALRPIPEPTNVEFPLTLLTGRGSAAVWHTNTRTGKSAVLRALAPEGAHIEIHPDDAAAFDVAPSSEVVVRSRRGEIRAKAFVTLSVPRGCVSMTMHSVETNLLTDAVFDPHSRQPAYKACAVAVFPG